MQILLYLEAPYIGLCFRLSALYKPRHANRCLRICAKCTDSVSFCACMKSRLDICSPLMQPVVFNDSGSGQQRP